MGICALPESEAIIDLSWTFEMIAKGHDFEKVDTDSMTVEVTEEDLWRNTVVLSTDELMRIDSLIFKVNVNVHDGKSDWDYRRAIDYWGKLTKHQDDIVAEAVNDQY